MKEQLHPRLNRAIDNVAALGYRVVETPSVRTRVKCVSADAKTRAAEFLLLYEDPAVAAILPPWGGEFLMDMLPFLDFDRLSTMPPKWVSGYSDTTTLTFPLTLLCDIATVHGSSLMNMGAARIDETDLRVFDVMSSLQTVQRSAPRFGAFTEFDNCDAEPYALTEKNRWAALGGETVLSFEGRMIGGCMDTLCKLIGTRFAPVDAFLTRYKNDGFIWALESCEMSAAEIYRTLWQMRMCGWFANCRGVLYGRAKGYADTADFTLTDALSQGLGALNVPVIHGADIGHIPPQMQFVNGAYGRVEFEDGRAAVTQWLSA